MKVSSIAFFASVFLTLQVHANCDGFNYGIGNVRGLGNGINRWDVYDDGCNVVDGLTTSGNPCDQGIFSCSAAPTIFIGYRNTFDGLQYYCRPDPSSGSCGDTAVSVCCRNDGN